MHTEKKVITIKKDKYNEEKVQNWKNYVSTTQVQRWERLFGIIPVSRVTAVTEDMTV